MDELFLAWLSASWLLPYALAVWAAIDVLRVGVSRWWLVPIILVPVVGPIGYYLLVRCPWAPAATALSGDVGLQARGARTRLAEHEVQLAHWRGAAVLAEAGEDLLVLGRAREAEARFREARDAGAPVEEGSWGLARALQAQGRLSEAIPFLQEVVAEKPDHAFGDALLDLARCLDEAGHAEAAEAALRDVLARRDKAEARVRLARLLMRRGEAGDVGAIGEAGRLLEELRDGSKTLVGFERRRVLPWLRAARRLTAGSTRLPSPPQAGIPRRQRRHVALTAGAVLLLALHLGSCVVPGLAYRAFGPDVADHQALFEATARLRTLDTEHPWNDVAAGRPFSEVTLDEALLERWLRVREGIVPELRRAAAADERMLSRSVTDVLLTAGEQVASKGALARAFADALEREAMGPTTFAAIVAMAEARHLERSAAMPYNLPEHLWAEWRQLRWQLPVPSNPSAIEPTDPSIPSAHDATRRREALAARRREEIAARARADLALTPATRELLARREKRLRALPADGLPSLLDTIDDAL